MAMSSLIDTSMTSRSPLRAPKRLSCNYSWRRSKTLLLSSSMKLSAPLNCPKLPLLLPTKPTKQLQAACGIKGDDTKMVPNLGVDFSFGKSRKMLGKTTTGYQRMAAAKRCQGRVHILRKVLGAKRTTLVAAPGVLAAAT